MSLTSHKETQLRSLLNLLSDGQFHSGQAIAERLSVSRAYIWKLKQSLQNYGLELESVTRKGYRLLMPVSLLEEKKIAASLKPFGIKSELVLDADSTNQQLKGDAFEHQKLLVAEYQSAGRGRRGRQWVSPLAANLYFSFAWHTPLAVQQLGGLSLIVGISICAALQKFGIKELKLKWPNDIRYQGKKLGGILVELSGDTSGSVDGDVQVIIGVGINIAMQGAVAQKIDQDWINLFDILEQQNKDAVCREEVLTEVVCAIQKNLFIFEEKGFEVFLQQWQQLDECYGKKVVIIQPKEDITGIGAGVDSAGAFLLQTGRGIKPIFSGEVSLRLR